MFMLWLGGPLWLFKAYKIYYALFKLAEKSHLGDCRMYIHCTCLYTRRQVIYILVHIYIYKYQEKEVENETRGFFENSLVTRKLFDSLRKIKHSNFNHNSMQYLFKYSS